MKIAGSIPRNRRLPSYRGRVMIDTIRGVLRVRKWPKKYGKPRSALQAWWVDWFRQANFLAKYADGMTQARAITLTKGTGLYPRDIMLKAMRGRLYYWTDETGWRWFPVAAIQDISDTLDVLAQTIGSVLVRAADRWRAAGPAVPVVGQALTYQGPGLPPKWANVGAGITQQQLPGTPIVVDNTQNEYILDVTGYVSVDLDLAAIKYAAVDYCLARVSLDGGVTYRSAGGDYLEMFLSSTAEVVGSSSAIIFARSAGALDHNCFARLVGLRAGAPHFLLDASYSTNKTARRTTRMQFDGPVTHIKLYTNGGSNFQTGTVRATGEVAA